MTANALQEHIDRTNKIDKRAYLGKLCWYTVSNVCISHQEVVKGLLKVGIGSQLPPPPREHDVFRRVSSNAGVKKVSTGVDGVFENYLVREVNGSGDNTITRRIVCEQVDRGAKNLTYNAELMDIEFSKDTNVIQVKELDASLSSSLDLDDQRRLSICRTITAEIRTEFATWRDKLNSYAIREFIRKMLLSQFQSTLVREGGGVYFVQEAHSQGMESLEEFVNAIPGAIFHSLPLIDDKKQREMIRNAYEAESIDAVDEFMAEISEIHQKGTIISQKRYAEMLGEYKDLTDKTASYGELLETAMGETKSRLTLFQAAIVGLKAKVRA